MNRVIIKLAREILRKFVPSIVTLTQRRTYAQAIASFLIAVVGVSYKGSEMSEGQLPKKCYTGPKPRFNNQNFRDGPYYLMCAIRLLKLALAGSPSYESDACLSSLF